MNMARISKLISPEPGSLVEITTTDAYSPPDHIEVTATGSYRLYVAGGLFRTAYIYKGIPFPGQGVVKATDTSGNALAAGLLYFVY